MAKKKISSETIEEIVYLNTAHYIGIQTLATKFGVNQQTLRNYFKEIGIIPIKANSTSVKNRRYFESIDSEEKAYILGWMFSDGNVCVSQKSLFRISLAVQDQDRFICDLMNASIGGHITLLDNSSKNWKDQVKFTTHSVSLTNDLLALGCMPNKTNYELKIPDIPKELIIHFIRGIFDGDGCISFYKKDKTITFKISCNSIIFLNQIGDFLKDLGVTKFIIISSKNTNCFNLEIKRKFDIKLLYTLLYDNSTLNLSRKRLKWIEYMEQIKY